MKNDEQQNLNHSLFALSSISTNPSNQASGSPSIPKINNNSNILSQHMNAGNTTSIKNIIKGLVSKNKRRFEWDGYDLDLTYITDNILAMGFPSQNLQSLYRNSLAQVQKFLEERHKHHYKVYNLCKQKQYSQDKFQGKFVEYPFEDHNAPPFDLIIRCCLDMKKWLQADHSNIVAIHCKAGKGRTGVIIGCLLLFMGVFQTADQCLKHYDDVRTIDSKGVTIPSQIRYVKYFQSALKIGIDSPMEYLLHNRKIKIIQVKMNFCPQINIFGGCTPWISILTENKQFRSKYSNQLITYETNEKVRILINMPFQIQRDFKLTFYSKGKIIKKSEEIMRVWLNCIFMPQKSLKLKLIDMDGVKSNDKRFHKDFEIQLTIKEV